MNDPKVRRYTWSLMGTPFVSVGLRSAGSSHPSGYARFRCHPSRDPQQGPSRRTGPSLFQRTADAANRGNQRGRTLQSLYARNRGKAGKGEG